MLGFHLAVILLLSVRWQIIVHKKAARCFIVRGKADHPSERIGLKIVIEEVSKTPPSTSSHHTYVKSRRNPQSHGEKNSVVSLRYPCERLKFSY